MVCNGPIRGSGSVGPRGRREMPCASVCGTALRGDGKAAAELCVVGSVGPPWPTRIPCAFAFGIAACVAGLSRRSRELRGQREWTRETNSWRSCGRLLGNLGSLPFHAASFSVNRASRRARFCLFLDPTMSLLKPPVLNRNAFSQPGTPNTQMKDYCKKSCVSCGCLARGLPPFTSTSAREYRCQPASVGSAVGSTR